MVAELATRGGHMKRRTVVEGSGTVNYISEQNRVFNVKAERALGKFSVDIKNALERGTA